MGKLITSIVVIFFNIAIAMVTFIIVAAIATWVGVEPRYSIVIGVLFSILIGYKLTRKRKKKKSTKGVITYGSPSVLN